MKNVVSVSIGSSLRDKKTEINLRGERIIIERIGTDGDMKKAVELIKTFDGKVDAIGIGGISFYLSSGKKKHLIRSALRFKKAAEKTPVVDGIGIKDTLEKMTVEYLSNKGIIELKGKKALVTCVVDRYNLTKALYDSGCDLLIGDFVFVLGLPYVMKDLNKFGKAADLLIPLVTRLPFKMLYPTGDKQKDSAKRDYSKYYNKVDIIAGDYHYIKRYLPDNMEGKTIITNTVTSEDVETLKRKKTKMLITAAPSFNGRSFGANVIEAVMVSVSGKKPEEITDGDYIKMLNEFDFKPRIEYLND